MRHRAALLLLALLCPVGCGDDGGSSDGWAFGDIFPPQPDYTTSGTCSTAGGCAGCCMGTTCMAGTDRQACGYGGVPCQTCQPSETCQMGFCTAPPCSASTCAAGCCDSAGKCQSGTTDQSCGTGGATCEACASDKVCSSNACTDKGPAMYKVTLESAKVTGSSWIVCGFAELSECDLYVTLKVGKAQATSSIKVDTNSPTWNEYMLTATGTDLTSSFEVEVRDDDPVGSVQIGSCTGSITSADLTAGTYVHDCGDAKQVTWKLESI